MWVRHGSCVAARYPPVNHPCTRECLPGLPAHHPAQLPAALLLQLILKAMELDRAKPSCMLETATTQLHAAEEPSTRSTWFVCSRHTPLRTPTTSLKSHPPLTALTYSHSRVPHLPHSARSYQHPAAHSVCSLAVPAMTAQNQLDTGTAHCTQLQLHSLMC